MVCVGGRADRRFWPDRAGRDRSAQGSGLFWAASRPIFPGRRAKCRVPLRRCTTSPPTPPTRLRSSSRAICARPRHGASSHLSRPRHTAGDAAKILSRHRTGDCSTCRRRRAFDRVLAMVTARGWTVITADPAAGIIDADDRRLLVSAFTDDIAIRVTAVPPPATRSTSAPARARDAVILASTPPVCAAFSRR